MRRRFLRPPGNAIITFALGKFDSPAGLKVINIDNQDREFQQNQHPFMRNTSKYLWSFFLLSGLLYSCYPWIVTKKMAQKHESCCFFDPMENKIQFDCNSQKLIHFRIIIASSDPNVSGQLFYEKELEPAAATFTIPSIADSIKLKRDIIIYLWKDSQVIHDYTLKIKPENWNTGHKVYGRYSYR